MQLKGVLQKVGGMRVVKRPQISLWLGCDLV